MTAGIDLFDTVENAVRDQVAHHPGSADAVIAAAVIDQLSPGALCELGIAAVHGRVWYAKHRNGGAV